MTEHHNPPTPAERTDQPIQDGGSSPYLPQAPGHQGFAAPYASPMGLGPVGKTRGTGVCVLLTIITFGVYSLYWYFATHEEMKRHTGRGIGGGIALLLAFFVGIAVPYVTSSEVGDLHARSGRAKPVSGATGLWYFPGIFILVGPLSGSSRPTGR